jgi:hypothetical protein
MSLIVILRSDAGVPLRLSRAKDHKIRPQSTLLAKRKDRTMLKKLMSSLMALTMAFGIMAAVPSDAEARNRGGRVAAGVAAGIIGLGVLGAYAHARDHGGHRTYYRSSGECYPGPERCGYTSRRCSYNSWGDYVCRGGQYRCWREEVCD